MLPDNAIAIEFAANSPCIAERLTVFGNEATPIGALRRMLMRFGLAPHLINFQKKDDEVVVVGRNAEGKPATFARILWGLPLADLDLARDELISEGWSPTTPKYEMQLPDGRSVTNG